MKKIAIATSLLLAVTSYVNADAAPEDEKWVAGFVEYYSTDQEKSGFPHFLDNGFGLGAEFGFRFEPEWAVRLEWSRLDIDGSTAGLDQTGNRVGVDALYFLPDDVLYLFGGLKYLTLDDSAGMADLGIGKHWPINDRWRVITEIAVYHDFGEAYNDVSAKLGIAYSFGGSSKPAMSNDSDNDGVMDSLDKCANTSAGASVDAMGCSVDSDGDGILNSLDQCQDTAPGTLVGAKGCSLVLDTDQDGVLDDEDKCADTPATDKVDPLGCSIFKESMVSVNLQVSFPNNSSVISNSSDQQFQKFADFMKRYPQTDSVIEGHASAPGEASYNLMLSEKRAASVRKLLIEKYGIPAQRLSSIGYGETQLLDTANTREANKINRRITAKVSASIREKVLKD